MTTAPNLGAATLLSVWCFFAAILSFIVYAYFRDPQHVLHIPERQWPDVFAQEQRVGHPKPALVPVLSKMMAELSGALEGTSTAK